MTDATPDASGRAPLSVVLVWILIGAGLGAFWREIFGLARGLF